MLVPPNSENSRFHAILLMSDLVSKLWDLIALTYRRNFEITISINVYVCNSFIRDFSSDM